MEPKREIGSLLDEFDRNIRRLPDDTARIKVLDALKRSGPTSLVKLGKELSLTPEQGAKVLSEAAYDGLIDLHPQDQNSDALVSLTPFGRRVAESSDG